MKHTKIMLRIVLLFAIVMLMSFIPENFREFFGDWQCQGGDYDYNTHQQIGCLYGVDGRHRPTWHWGFRHWVWMFMGVILFFYNAILIVGKMDDETKN